MDCALLHLFLAFIWPVRQYICCLLWSACQTEYLKIGLAVRLLFRFGVAMQLCYFRFGLTLKLVFKVWFDSETGI